MNSPKNILIVRTDRIGDVVLSFPIASVIKKHFPECKVSFLLREYTRPLAENNPFIDEVIVLIEKDGRASVPANVAQLKNRFDTCIVAFPTYPIALILFLSNITNRIGTGYRWYSFLLNKKVYEHRKYGERHELEYNVRLLQHLGINEEVNEENVLFGMSSSIESKEKVSTELKSLGINKNKPIVIVHPGSGGSAVDLPMDKMKEVLKLISKENVEILITGSKTEKELCQSLVVSNNVINVAGKFNLRDLIALIDQSDLLIANSTGPIHIAAALGKNVIGFYPKVVTCAPKRWGPYTNKKTIFSPTIDCKECTTKQCKKLNCMESINPVEVGNAVKIILQKISAEKK